MKSLVAEAMQQQGRPAACSVRTSRLEWKPFASAATKTRSVPAKPRSTRSSGKFPEANRYPFNSTPLDADLEILIAKLNNAQA